MWKVISSCSFEASLSLQNPHAAEGELANAPKFFQCNRCDAIVWVKLPRPFAHVLLRRCTVLGDEWGNRVLEHDFDLM